LLGGSMRVGAIIARTSEKNAQLIYDFGESVGMAFQLQDDYLDAFGDEDIFGKKNGGDIRANKKTYLYLKALELGSRKQQNELKELFNIQEEDNDEKVIRVLEIFNDLNIKAETQSLMDCYYDKAMKTLEKIDLNQEKRGILVKLAEGLMNRDN